ncbi:MAG: hypothetical protein ACFBQW_07375 [Sphingomonadaceae bacterium]
MTVELTPTRAAAEWVFLKTVRERSTALSGDHRTTVEHGANRLSA